MKCIHLSVFALLVSAAFAGYGASTYYVSPTGRASGATGAEDDPFPTIQDGLNVATNRKDAVIVADGTYLISEPLTNSTTTITLRSASGNRDAVVIDALNQCAILSLAGTYVTLSGMTFKNGRSTVAGVRLSGLGSVISNVHVTGCSVLTTSDASGGGLVLGGNGSFVCDSVVDNCEIVDMQPAGTTTVLQLRGGGIWIGVGGAAYRTVVSNCSIRAYCDQSTYPQVGGGIFGYSATVEDCTVSHCSVSNTSNAVDWPQSKHRGGFGGGVSLHRYSDGHLPVVLRNCLIVENEASYQSAGVYCSGDDALVEGCKIVGNVLRPLQSTYSGAGSALCLNGKRTIVRNCQIVSNVTVAAVSSSGGGSIAYLSGDQSGSILQDTLIADNVGAYASGISLLGKGVTVSNCVIRGNKPTTGVDAAVIYSYCANECLFADCWLTDNLGSGFGALLSSYQSASQTGAYAVKFRNCLITRNDFTSSTQSALLYWWVTNAGYDNRLVFENCTIAGNMTDYQYSYAISGRNATLGGNNIYCYGSVVWGNGKSGNLNFRNTTSTEKGHVQYTYTTGNVSTEAEDHNIVSTDDPGFVDAANGDYRPVSDKCALAGKVPYADWMGGRKTKDLGDGTYTITPSGKYGVVISRNKPVRRSYDNLADIGCFEFPRPSGLMLLFR